MLTYTDWLSETLQNIKISDYKIIYTKLFKNIKIDTFLVEKFVDICNKIYTKEVLPILNKETALDPVSPELYNKAKSTRLKDGKFTGKIYKLDSVPPEYEFDADYNAIGNLLKIIRYHAPKEFLKEGYTIVNLASIIKNADELDAAGAIESSCKTMTQKPFPTQASDKDNIKKFIDTKTFKLNTDALKEHIMRIQDDDTGLLMKKIFLSISDYNTLCQHLIELDKEYKNIKDKEDALAMAEKEKNKPWYKKLFRI